MKAVSLIVAVVAVALLASVDAVDVARRQKLKTRMSDWKVARTRAAVPKDGDACKVPYKGTGVCMKQNKCPTATHAFEAGPKIPCPAAIGCCYIRAVKPTPTKPVTPTPVKPTTPTTPTTPSVPATPTTPVTPSTPSTPSTPASNSGSNAGSGSGASAGAGGAYNPSNPLSVTRSANPVKLIGGGNAYCSATWANARKKNNFWWNECINQFDAYSGGQKCVWSIEDEQCVSRNDQSNIGILQHALKYTAEFVSAHYAAAPVSYVILSDPLSVSTVVSSPNYAAGTIGICKDMRSWKSCLLSVDDQAPKQHCQWSIELMMCVSATDKLNTKAVATASAYPATFVRDHYYAAEPSSKGTPIPDPIPAPIGDLSNLKLVKRADKPIAMVGAGNAYCSATWANARKKNNFLWNECINQFDAYSGGAKCVWSIEDHTCVSQTDNSNLAIVAHALAYTPSYVAAYYAANPVNYVILSDPLSVSTVVSSPNYASGTNGNCKDMRSWKACLLSVDEQSPANHCLWSIEYMMCVSSTDTVNTKVVAAAKQYPATFVRDHYYAAEPSSKQVPIPDPIPATVGNADSKKAVGPSAKPIAMVGTGNAYCYNAKAQATKKNSFWWQECINQFDAYSGGSKCVWSIEDTQCVSQSDTANIGIVAHALAYTPSYISAYYAKNPMSYVNLADPKSVSTTGQPPVQASNSQCLLNKQYWSCLIAADELAPGKMCLWSIESGACVSVNDPKNAAVAATALKYTPEFVKAHYEAK